MDDEAEFWELRHGAEVVGRLTITDQDMFWFTAHFEPTPLYAEYQPIIEAAPDSDEGWRAWYEQVQRLGLHLIRLYNQATAHEFILYIQGDRADFRPVFDDTNPNRQQRS